MEQCIHLFLNRNTSGSLCRTFTPLSSIRYFEPILAWRPLADMTDLFATLSAHGLSRIPEHSLYNDFDFIVGDRHYLCPRYMADFLSPLLCRLHSLDLSLDHFFVATEDPHNYFKDLLSLARGGSVLLTDDSCSFLRSVALELESEELFAQASMYLDKELTVANAFDTLRSLRRNQLPTTSVIDFIASNFTEFGSDSFASLAFDDLERLLRHPSLRLRHEDEIFNVIASHLEDDTSFFRLFEYVRFEYLSRTSVSDFAELAVQHFDNFTVALWSRITPCLAPTGAIKPDPSDGAAPGGNLPLPDAREGGFRANDGVVELGVRGPAVGVLASDDASGEADDLSSDDFVLALDFDDV
jgi:hypothetical protein